MTYSFFLPTGVFFGMVAIIFCCSKRLKKIQGSLLYLIASILLTIGCAFFVLRNELYLVRWGITPYKGVIPGHNFSKLLSASRASVIVEWLKTQNLADQKILIIAEEDWENTPGTVAFRDNLIASGIPLENITIDSILPPELDENGRIKPSPYPTECRANDPKKYNTKFKEYPDHKIILLLVGLPLTNMKAVDPVRLPYSPDAQQLIVLGPPPTDLAAFQRGMTNGNVAAYIQENQNYEFFIGEKQKTQREIFDLRYHFITKDQNFDKLKAKRRRR